MKNHCYREEHFFESLSTNRQNIQKRLIPATILLETSKLYLSKPKIYFGTYILAYTRTKNGMITQGLSTIGIHKLNRQDHFYLASLNVGHQCYPYDWK